MRKIPPSVAMALLWALFVPGSDSAQAQQQQAKVDPPWVTAAKDSGLVYRVPGMDDVRVEKDIVYKRIGTDELLLDLYLPSLDSPGPYPVVILIHGGPLPSNLRTTVKNWAIFTSYGRVLAASGVAAVTFDHRLYSERAFATSAEDVAALLQHVRANSIALGIDATRICLFAFSYGGPHLASVIREQPPYVRCALAGSAVFGVRGDTSAQMSPLAALRSVERVRFPIFVARAGRDAPWINAFADSFIAEALRKNVQLDLHNYSEGAHSFDMRNDTDESRAIIAASLAFVRRHLARVPGARE